MATVHLGYTQNIELKSNDLTTKRMAYQRPSRHEPQGIMNSQ